MKDVANNFPAGESPHVAPTRTLTQVRQWLVEHGANVIPPGLAPQAWDILVGLAEGVENVDRTSREQSALFARVDCGELSEDDALPRAKKLNEEWEQGRRRVEALQRRADRYAAYVACSSRSSTQPAHRPVLRLSNAKRAPRRPRKSKASRPASSADDGPSPEPPKPTYRRDRAAREGKDSGDWIGDRFSGSGFPGSWMPRAPSEFPTPTEIISDRLTGRKGEPK